MNLARTIIAVEDSDEDFDTISNAYHSWAKDRAGRSFELKRVQTGEDCYKMLSDDPSNAQPLVLLDLNLPGQGGHKTLQMIKQSEQLRIVPVVVLSSSSARSDIEFCHSHGANAYHVKPFRYDQFLSMLDTLFEYWSVTSTLKRTLS